MRYRNAQIKKDKDGKRYYAPTKIANIPIKDSDIFVYPIYGDRFDTLAQKYYGDSNLWGIIAKANELNKGKIGLDPEKKIRIPTQIGDILSSTEGSGY